MDEVVSSHVKNINKFVFFVEVQTCFDLFDLHGSGAITGIELQKVAQSVGRELTEEDVTEIIAEVDESGTLILFHSSLPRK